MVNYELRLVLSTPSPQHRGIQIFHALIPWVILAPAARGAGPRLCVLSGQQLHRAMRESSSSSTDHTASLQLGISICLLSL